MKARSGVTELKNAAVITMAAKSAKILLENYQQPLDSKISPDALKNACTKVINAYNSITDSTLPLVKKTVTAAFTSLCETHDKLKGQEGYADFLKAKGLEGVVKDLVIKPEQESRPTPTGPSGSKTG